MRIGVIADTHGFFDPRIVRHFVGVEHIIHAFFVGIIAPLQKQKALYLPHIDRLRWSLVIGHWSVF